ncbi:hypothetical protein [Mesonia aestuariivivens]|nr:hypothetical protein [Mesonia aestuariivivens]
MIKHFKPNVNSYIDLGYGDGVLGKTMYTNWIESNVLFQQKV